MPMHFYATHICAIMLNFHGFLYWQRELYITFTRNINILGLFVLIMELYASFPKIIKSFKFPLNTKIYANSETTHQDNTCI